MATELLSGESKTILARESTYGTDEIDLANNLAVARRYEAFTAVTVVPNGDFRERNITRPSFSNNRGQYSPRNQTFTFEGIVPAPTTAGDLDKHGLSDLLVASGMTEALSAGVTSTYTMSTTATAGLTCYTYKRHADAFVWRMTYGVGIRTNMSISGSIRDFVTFTATGEAKNFPVSSDTANFKGWSDDLAFFDSDGTIALQKTGAAITYTGTETMDDARGLFLEPTSVITIDSVAFPISAFQLDWGNNVKVKEATSSSATETAGSYVTGRNVNGNFTLADTGAAYEKACAMLHADSEVSATIVLTDGLGSGGTTVTITMGDLQFRSVDGPNDDEGLAAWTLPFQANADWSNELGDNELTLVWSVTA